MRTKLVLNVAPVRFENAPISIGVLEYLSNEHLRSLRDEHAATHVFQRRGTHVHSVAVVPGAAILGEPLDGTKSSLLRDHLSLCASLISNSLINYFHSIGRRVLGYRPIKFVANDPASNLLASALPEGVERPNWLAVKPVFEASVRVIVPDRQEAFVGMALDVRTTRLISMSCAELIAEGFDPTGLYVGRHVPIPDRRIAPRLELLGRVATVRGETLHLTDARPGLDQIDASEAVLELRNDAFARCLSHAFGSASRRVQDLLDRQLETFRSGPERLQRLRKVVSHIANQSLEMIPGVPFTFDQFLAERQRRFPSVQTAPRAVFVFDPSGTRTNTWHDGGLDNYGPYSSRTFTPTHPRICVVCQKSKKGQVEQFVHKLLNGIRPVGARRAPFVKGFIRKYQLEDVSTEFFTTEDETAASYKKAIRRALEHHGIQGPRWNLALVQIDDHFHELSGPDNPYLVTKAAFLQHQIPTQEFAIETVDIPDKRLGYVLNNMALATYAKLGGIPWLIKADPAIAHELVIGLGSARIGEGRLGDSEQVVGITTVFTGDGNYCVTNVSKVVPIAEYKQELLATLRTSINQVRGEMNWQRREPVRLVFHAFKPLKDAETEAVKALMTELGEFDVDYAFLHIVENHPYLLFDELQQGVRDFETGHMKGVFAPTRGMFFRLSKRDVLISLTGARDVKQPRDGIPHPILLSLHHGSTFEDTTYLARQVYTFACHSWRSFFPSPIPVTILYSELIAKLLGHLSTLPTWDPDVMLGRIGRTRWFL